MVLNESIVVSPRACKTSNRARDRLFEATSMALVSPHSSLESMLWQSCRAEFPLQEHTDSLLWAIQTHAARFAPVMFSIWIRRIPSPAVYRVANPNVPNVALPKYSCRRLVFTKLSDCARTSSIAFHTAASILIFE